MSIKQSEAEDLQANLAIFGSHIESPEKNLMVAMIIQVKLDLSSKSKRRSELALTWFLTTKEEDHSGHPWLFSFQNICEQLDVDPDIILRELLKQRESP